MSICNKDNTASESRLLTRVLRRNFAILCNRAVWDWSQHTWLQILALELNGWGVEGATLDLSLLICGLWIITPPNLVYEDHSG